MRPLLVTAVAVVLALGHPQPGQACSRPAFLVPIDPRAFVSAADAAFVGTLVSVRPLHPPPEPPGGPALASSADPYVLTFAVEQRVKGDLPDRVEIVSALGGASCGFEGTLGERGGLLLHRRTDDWGPWGLEQIDVETLRRGALPLPEPNGAGRPVLLLGGSFGGARAATVDRRGRTLAYGWGSGGVSALAVCPGGAVSVELVDGGSESLVALRRLPDLALVSERTIPATAGSQVSCLDRKGMDVLAVTSHWAGNALETDLVRSTPFGTTVLERGSGLSVAVRAATALVSFASGDLIARDLGGGQRRGVARTAGLLTGISVSPDGRLVAGYADGRLTLVDLARGRTRTRHGSNQGGQTAWLDRRTLMVAERDLSSRSLGRLDVVDPSLRPLRPTIAWTPRLTALGAGTAFGVEWWNALVSAGATGPVVRNSNLFSPAVAAMAVLPPG